MTPQATTLTVRKTITVNAPQAHAFAVFTEQMSSWWPFDTKAIGQSRAEATIVEPRAGGRWFERGVDGTECDWGRVIAYEPPARLVLNWQISADWRYDGSVNTEVEVRFVAADADRTRVELEHRGLLEGYGGDADQVYAIFDSPGGWTDILNHYAKAASA